MADFTVVRTDRIVKKGVLTGQAGVYATDYDLYEKATVCYGNGVPPSGKKGYAYGCTYRRTSNGALYTNTGGPVSCTFALQVPPSTGSVAVVDLALTNGHIIVGNGSGDGADVAMSGDATISNTGVVTLAVPKVAAIVSQSLAASAFTDGGGTTGYIDITTQVPAGSFVLGWKAVASAGFAGDTTATVQVGVSGTVDKYSVVTTGSVFASGTVGSSVKAGNNFEATAVTARVTVTSSADFTSVVSGGGVMVVTLYVVKTV